MVSARPLAVLLVLALPACGSAPAHPAPMHASFAQCEGAAVAERAPCVVDALVATARQERDVVALGCLTQKRDAMEPLLGVLRAHSARTEADLDVRIEVTRRLDVLQQEAEQCPGFDAAAGTTVVEVARQ